jgi:hypothetical protein
MLSPSIPGVLESTAHPIQNSSSPTNGRVRGRTILSFYGPHIPRCYFLQEAASMFLVRDIMYCKPREGTPYG